MIIAAYCCYCGVSAVTETMLEPGWKRTIQWDGDRVHKILRNGGTSMLKWAQVNTILGPGSIASSDIGLCYFSVYSGLRDMKYWLASHYPEEDMIMVPESPYLAEALRQLDEYLGGRRRVFTISLDLKGTQFQTRVWETLLKVPYGLTITYSALATKAGYPQAARAVGNAMRANPLPVFVPCHRVLPANGSLGTYAGGKDLKRWLLELEGKQ
jgi:O-6-methylguanine DNA methyltransferase